MLIDTPAKQRLIYACIALFLLVSGFLAYQSKPPAPPQADTDYIAPSLALTPEEFRERFNQQSRRQQQDWQIEKLPVSPGLAQDKFEVNLASDLTLLGVVNQEDGKMRSLTLVSRGDASIHSGTARLQLLQILLACIQPELSADQRLALFEQLGLLTKSSQLPDKGAARNGPVQYSFQYQGSSGLWFHIVAADRP